MPLRLMEGTGPSVRSEEALKKPAWDKTLSVEVAEIDEDHRRLLDLFNLFAAAVEAGDPLEYRAAVLEELIACTVWHFRHEERLMLRYGYEGYEEHRREHQELIAGARTFQEGYLSSGGKASAEDFEHLEHWLTEHILVADMPLGAQLAGKM